MAIATGTAIAIAAGVGAGTTVAGTVVANRGAKSAQQKQEETIDKQLTWEREQEARRQEEYDRTEAENIRRWETEQRRDDDQRRIENATRAGDQALQREQWETTEAGRAPYRQVGSAALHDVASKLGITVRPIGPAAPGEGRMSDLARY